MCNPLDVDLLAASLRADAADNSVLLEALAGKFASALPGLVKVRRRGLRGRGPVSEVTIDLGNTRLQMTVEGSRLVPMSSTLSGGIVIKNREVGVDEWIADLSAGLAQAAQRDALMAQALTNLLTD